jgi:transcriptional regulator with XRE-family HTH domain
MTETLAQRLRRAREKAGLSQRQLAHAVGISAQAIQHIEAGTTLRSRYVTDIARALGVDVEWLDGGILASHATNEVHKIDETETHRLKEGTLTSKPIHDEYLDTGGPGAKMGTRVLDIPENVTDDVDEQLGFSDAEMSGQNGSIPAFTALPLSYVGSKEKRQRAKKALERHFPDVSLPPQKPRILIPNSVRLGHAACVAAGLDQGLQMPRPPVTEGLSGCYAYDVGLIDGLGSLSDVGAIVISCAEPAHNARPRGMSTVWIRNNLFFPAFVSNSSKNGEVQGLIFTRNMADTRFSIPSNQVKRIDKILTIDFVPPREFAEYARTLLKELILGLREGRFPENDN